MPLSRSSSRPVAPSSFSAQSLASVTAGLVSGERPLKRSLRSSCGNGVNMRSTWLAGCPRSTSTDNTCSAAISPSPVVAKSDSTMWPDCSPPRFMPSSRIRSTT